MEYENDVPEFRTTLDEEIYKRYPAVYRRLFSYFTEKLPDERHSVSTSALVEETGFITREAVIRYVLGRVSWAREASDRHFVYVVDPSGESEPEQQTDNTVSLPVSRRENLPLAEHVRFVLKKETARNRLGVSLLYLKHLSGNPDEHILERILTEAEWAKKQFGLYLYAETASEPETVTEEPTEPSLEEDSAVIPVEKTAETVFDLPDELQKEIDTEPADDAEPMMLEEEPESNENALTLAQRFGLDPDDFAQIEIETLDLSARAYNCMRRGNVKTVADLLRLTEAELRGIRNFGQKTWDEIMTRVSTLSEELPELRRMQTSAAYPLQSNSRLSRNRDLILRGEFDNPVFTDLSADEADQFRKLREAYDCLSGTGILELIDDPDRMAIYKNILDSLKGYYPQCREIRELIEKLPPERRRTSIRVYMDAYAGDDPERRRLPELTDASVEDGSFGNLTAKAGTYTSEDMTMIRAFLSWCAYDLNATIDAVIEKVVDNDRLRRILQLRAERKAYDRISAEIGLTKERIRQILLRACRSFLYWENRLRLMNRISADMEKAVFSPEDVKRCCGRDVGIFLCLARISLSSHYSYDSEHDLFVIGNENTEQRVRDYLAARKEERPQQTKPELPEDESEDDVSELPNAYLYHLIPELKEYTEKLEHELRSCIFVGDIVIDDEEYALLCRSLKLIVERYYAQDKYYTSVAVSVALVQIGLRQYDGRFWPHVEEVLGLNIDGPRQKWLGRCFYYTLQKFGKYRVSKGEMMNNILLHCFITDHYADDLFDFLFAYYSIDLERDLNNNTEERMDYLIRSMKNTERSARSYKIKRHTADAVTANEEECGKRINMILNYIDAGFFRQEYPTDSVNRIARLFCAWEERTSKLEYNRKVWTPTAKGTKQYKSPYLRFNGRREQFELILPEQFVRLEDEDDVPGIYWEIMLNGEIRTIDTEPENGVTGCKTNRLSVTIENSADIFSRYIVSLYKEDVRLNYTLIPENPARFFDMSGDGLACDGYIPEGEACAFVREGCELLVSEQALIDEEIHAELTMLHLELTTGDVLRLPDGKALPVGRPLDEGLLDFAKVPGVYVMEEEEQLPVYHAVPNIFFRMNPGQEAGTRIQINGFYERLRPDGYTRYEEDSGGDETGYTLVLGQYLEKSGVYDVVIDIPNSQKRREYRFAYIVGLGYHFSKPVYVFEESGAIRFHDGISVDCLEDDVDRKGNQFAFPILPGRDELSFAITTEDKELQLRVYLPLFQWRFDNGKWNTEKPEELWHLEFPKVITLKHPDDDVEFSMPPALLRTTDEDTREPVRFSAVFHKDKDQHLFVCDTRKMLSWLGYEEPIRLLTVSFSDHRIPFVHIITRCFLPDKRYVIDEKRDPGELVFKTNVLGFADCRADIFRGEDRIAEKLPITTGGIRVRCPFITGDYRIDFYEENEEDDFGLEEYRKFDSLICHYENKNDLSGKTLIIKGIKEYKQKNSIFAVKQYLLAEPLIVEELVPNPDHPDGYVGKSTFKSEKVDVAVEFPSEDRRKAYITYYNQEEECFVDFFYDSAQRTIQTDECTHLMLDPDKHYFEIEIK